MSRIFDNIDLHLGNHLQNVIADYDKLDAAVGYFNLRGWQFFAPIVDSKPFKDGSPVARVLVGMSGVDPDQAVTDFLQSSVNGSVAADGIDGSVARERRQQAIYKFREQLSRGVLDHAHYEALRTLKRHLQEGRVQIKLFTRRPLHGKTYICHREDVTNPITAFVGSSNLTMSGLQHNYELNVDVVDWDGTKVLAKWFEDRWNDRYTIEITTDLIELIQESWAGDNQPSPYDVYLKVCWHLSRDVRDGLAEYGVPTALQSELLDYQSSAVKTLARRIATRGGAMLGAEEYGFATAPLVVSGCVMMRVCHLDTCPVGVATQNPELRKRFTGKPEFVETFFEYIAEEVREWLAKLGFRSLDEAIGQVELLDTKKAIDHWKASGLDLSPILEFPSQSKFPTRKREISQDHGLTGALDFKLIELAKSALESGKHTTISMPITNRNRTVGTILGSEITKRYGGAGLPEDTIDITLHGSAGQSLGAFIPRGLTIRLYGDVNDHLGKGISGGRLIVRPDEKAKLDSEKNIIAGNVVGYGATSGEIFVRGIVGERFCVRNSGATAVVEGTGDHGCEYMTGGTVVVLGKTGRNFAAGMSGGVAYLLDLDARLVNTELVDLQPVPAEDSERLLAIVSKFFAETGSKVADSLMKDWQKSLSRFTRVMPRDYARILKIISSAKSSGKSVDAAIIEVLNG